VSCLCRIGEGSTLQRQKERLVELCRDYNGHITTKYYGNSELYKVVIKLEIADKNQKYSQSGDSLRYCLSKILNKIQESMNQEENQCPECLEWTQQSELDMFNGWCEICRGKEYDLLDDSNI